MDTQSIQAYLREHKLDGWLLYDFQGLNPIALRMIGRECAMLTRRWFYLIPAEGSAVALVHKIEEHQFKGLPGRLKTFTSWQSMEKGLKDMLKGRVRIAMEYSPRCAIPYISRIDAGTAELVRAAGASIISSADMVQYFTSRWTDSELATHKTAARNLVEIVRLSFAEIALRVGAGESIDEFGLQELIVHKYEEMNMFSEHRPIVAVNENSGNPHYSPSEAVTKPITKGDLVLLDIWAKLKGSSTIYADVTWVGYVGDSVPERYREIFEVVSGARDEALHFIQQSCREGRVLHGWEVDDVARNHIAKTGYGPFFIHRTGHSIGYQDHYTGVNMDNLESRDERELIEGVGFSIEPGIYLKEFGVRSEINVYVGKGEALCTTEPQKEVIAILQ
ncbi:MAG: aminopeptidase P family protein [Acidobacteria bacterium]|nr:aminopeptidase P family protein [Acidobacteriota bacterium]